MVGKRRGRHPSNALDARKVAALIRKGEPGRFFDGSGLHLLVKPTGSASWVLRVAAAGKRRDYGVGGADVVGLAEARETARAWRALVKSGGDPTDERRKRRAIPTFEEVARSVHAEHKAAWRNKKHAAQWLSTLETYAFPDMGNVRVDLVNVADVLRVLSPIWLAKPETARRLRQRLRTVFDVARAANYRTAENPVGTILIKALPRQTAKRGHHSSMPYSDVPAFFSRLEDAEAGGEVSRLALRLLILTATRTSETLLARWEEFDLDSAVWTIPAARMKTSVEHRVPLSEPSLAVLRRVLDLSTGSEIIFPGARVGRSLSNMAMLMLMRRAGLTSVPHGFRSSFRDWASEQTSFPHQVAEMALGHIVGSRVERAYARSDLFEKRRQLMNAWGSFVAKALADVVPLRAKAGRR